MFDNLRKNSYGNIQVRVYFEDLDIVEHYLTRFEKALHKVRIVGDKLKRYIKKNKIKSDIEKVCIVFNYIFKNISYDYEYLNLDKKSKKVGFDNLSALEKRKIFRTQTLEGIFTKKTVCTGFSYIFKMLLEYIGIESNICIGYFKIGKGKKVDEIINEMKMVAEGLPTSKALYNIIQKYSLRAPVFTELYALLYENNNVKDLLPTFMSRELKSEF